MKLVFNLDGVICTPPKGVQFGLVEYIKHSKPIVNVVEFMQWLKKEHHITIWTNRPNDLAVKYATENWLDLNGVPYDRLLFDRPDDAIYVNETPSNAKYYAYDDDNFVYLSGEKGTVIVNKKDIIAVKQLPK